MGDFNVHYEDLNDPVAVCLRELLRAYNMTQHVQEATHTSGHILDQCITRHDSRWINATVKELIIDHYVVKCTAMLPVPRAHARNAHRKIRTIDPVAFSKDLQQSSFLQALVICSSV